MGARPIPVSMRFNLAAPGANANERAQMHRAMLAMAKFADANGFRDISIAEHHGTDLGWTPAPLPLAAAMLGATERIFVGVAALVLPLHDPIRVAEDVAALDLAFGMRFSLTVALGYRPEEYAAFGVPWDGRGTRFDACIEAMLQAWTGEAFDHDGRTVRVTPTPATAPHPIVMVGGSSAIAARRAARFGLGFAPQSHLPAIAELYEQECAARGITPLLYMPPPHLITTHLSADPERAWAELGQHFLAETRVYDQWQAPGPESAVASGAESVDELRANGPYQIVTPAEHVEQLRAAGRGAYAFFHPLVGGMPIDEAWRSLQLYVDEVVPALAGSED